MNDGLTRRQILAGAMAIPAAAPGAARPAVALFSKPLQHLKPAELGAAIRKTGLQHVDLTVRPGGHVLPERVREDLPRAVEALRKEGVSTAMITTALTSARDPHAREILSTAARLGIPLFKPGYWRYRDAEIEKALESVSQDVRGLAELCKEIGIQAAWHNHSGDYVGHAIWDARHIIVQHDSRWLGYYYDTSHAFSEGGVAGWNVGLRLALPRLKVVGVKDHLWERIKGQWRRRTCPLGEGMVDFARVFSILAKARFAGVISLHIEYETPDPVAAIARDARFLLEKLAEAYS